MNVGIGLCGPIPALFKSARIGPSAFKPCSDVFKSARTTFINVNITYTSAFGRPIPALLKALA